MLAGCSGGVPEPDESSPQPTGPLEEYVGYGDTIDSAESWVTQLTWQEERIAACMAAEGFEYTPQVPAVAEIEHTGGALPGTREFVEAYGYGAWVSPPGGTGGGFSYTRPSDPNWERRKAMSEAEGEAYDSALMGPVLSEDANGTIMREGGCLDRVGDPEGADADYLKEVRDDARGFLEALAGDGRFDEVNGAWAACMAEAGFTYTTPVDAQDEFLDAVLAEVADGIGPDPDVAAEHSVEEVRVAVADLDCQEATDWVARHRAVEVELQQEYVDAHLADLEALAAAVPAARPAD